jgi:hypothetical protein
MSKTSTVGQRIAGSVVGLLVCGVPLGALLVGLYGQSWGEDWAWGAFIFYGGLGFLIGGTIGAAGGATVAQKRLRWRSSFWRALLGAVVGLLIGLPFVLTVYGIPIVPIPIVAGAVIGSVWGAKPADAPSSEAEPGSTFERHGSDTHCKSVVLSLSGQEDPVGNATM